MNIMLWPVVLLLMFLLSGCDLRTLTKQPGEPEQRYRDMQHPLRYDVYVKAQDVLDAKNVYANPSERDIKTHDVGKILRKALRACYLPSQQNAPENTTVHDIEKICTTNYFEHSEGGAVRSGYDERHFNSERSELSLCSPDKWRQRQRVARRNRASKVLDPLSNALVSALKYIVGSDAKPDDTVAEFQGSKFGPVLEARYKAAVGNPKILNDVCTGYDQVLYGYYFQNPRFVDFLEKMEQSDSPKARRFVPLADFYTLRHAICAEADYNSLSGDLKLKWMALVFSRLTLSLYALRDVFSGILELGPNDAKAPEDLAEALHSFFVEAHGSESGTIAEPMYELFDHFDLFELAYAGCIRNTNAPLYLIEDYGAWTYKREIKEHLDAHARSFITSMLALSKAWQISRDGKITKQALESAAEEINNFNRENDECS